MESRPVRIVGSSLLSTVLCLVYCVGGIFLCKNIPSSSFSSVYYMVLGVLTFHFLYHTHIYYLTHCGRVTQICVFNTVKLGTSASSP